MRVLAQAVWTYEELEQVPRAHRVEVEASSWTTGGWPT